MQPPASEEMQHPLFRQDATYAFFLKDTSLRLNRASEQALAYALFALLLYLRLARLMALEPGFWWVIFLPLFAMDARNVQHLLYLRKNTGRFSPYDATRFMVIASSECLYKLALCMYLSVPGLESQNGGLSVKLVMIPFVAGYLVHFVLGHCMPLEDELVRAESCNAVAWLVSELGRFLEFVLVVSLSMKVDDTSGNMYDWEAAFWPVWGLEGMLALLVCLILPMLPFIFLSGNWPRLTMVVWISGVAVSLGVALALTISNVAGLMDNDLCPGGPQAAIQHDDGTCQARLTAAIVPWVVFGPCFAALTTGIKRRLAETLHEAWFTVPRLAAPHRRPPVVEVEVHPVPEVLFRVTPTFYSRDPSPEDLPEDSLGSTTHYSVVPSSIGGHRGSARASALGGSAMCTTSVVGGSVFGSRYHDTAGSVMSARGGTYAQIVESEQLCFICYSSYPDAVLLECGHSGLCTECASRMMDRAQANCPICRMVIGQVVQLRGDLPVPPILFTGRSIGAGRSPHSRLTSPCGLTRLTSPGAYAKAIGEFDSESGSSAMESNEAVGPPWPAVTKKSAVVVRPVRQFQRAEGDEPPGA